MQDGLEDVEIMYVGCLPVELDPDEQDVSALCFELGLSTSTSFHSCMHRLLCAAIMACGIWRAVPKYEV